MEPCKGLFWWTGERLLCVQFSCGADGNALGDAAPLADWNNHRRAWARLPKDVTQGKVLSPLLCREEVVLQVKDAFGLDQLPVLLKADGSHHYRCYLDE